MTEKHQELPAEIRMIDSHAHLDMDAFDDDRHKIIDRAQKDGLGMLLVGINLSSSHQAHEIARAHNFIWSSCGIHPHESEKTDEVLWEEVEKFCSHEDSIAIGEIGLDYFRNYAPHDVQKKVFIRQLEIARTLEKPVIIHSRAAFVDTYNLLQDFTGLRGVIHCFSGTLDEAKKFLDRGYYISIPGTITFPKNVQLREVVHYLPRDRILIETDCPYLAPQRFRGKRNEPAYVRYVAEEIGRVKNISLEEILLRTTGNFVNLFLNPK